MSHQIQKYDVTTEELRSYQLFGALSHLHDTCRQFGARLLLLPSSELQIDFPVELPPSHRSNLFQTVKLEFYESLGGLSLLDFPQHKYRLDLAKDLRQRLDNLPRSVKNPTLAILKTPIGHVLLDAATGEYQKALYEGGERPMVDLCYCDSTGIPLPEIGGFTNFAPVSNVTWIGPDYPSYPSRFRLYQRIRKEHYSDQRRALAPPTLEESLLYLPNLSAPISAHMEKARSGMEPTLAIEYSSNQYMRLYFRDGFYEIWSITQTSQQHSPHSSPLGFEERRYPRFRVQADDNSAHLLSLYTIRASHQSNPFQPLRPGFFLPTEDPAP